LTLPTDTSEYCGEKVLTFYINGTLTNSLSGLNSDYIYLDALNFPTIWEG